MHYMLADLDIDEIPQLLILDDLLDGGIPGEGYRGGHHLSHQMRPVHGCLQHFPGLFRIHGLHRNTLFYIVLPVQRAVQYIRVMKIHTLVCNMLGCMFSM